MPIRLIKDEIMQEPIVVFKYQSISRQTKIYSCEDISQVMSLTSKMVLRKKKKKDLSLLAFHTNVEGDSNLVLEFKIYFGDYQENKKARVQK